MECMWKQFNWVWLNGIDISHYIITRLYSKQYNPTTSTSRVAYTKYNSVITISYTYIYGTKNDKGELKESETNDVAIGIDRRRGRGRGEREGRERYRVEMES